MKRRLITLALITGFATPATGREPPVPGTATSATAQANARVAAALPLSDPSDMADATRGRLAQIEGGVIRNAKGDVVWDANSYAFLTGAAPASVNPSLWRQSTLNAQHGLFEVVPGIYQFRGYDISVMTIIRGKTGWIIVDPLTSVETAAAGLALVNKTLGTRPVSGIIFTHSHGDHYGGVNALANPAELASGGIPIVAPHGFILEAVSENVLAGNYMGRRAGFQFGATLPRGPAGQVGTGLGQALPSRSRGSLAKPTLEVAADAAPVEIDGIVFNFIDAAASEAPAEFMFYLPQFKALCSAEVATGTFHNVLTQRGAKVRDTLGWSKAIDRALRFYGVNFLRTSPRHLPFHPRSDCAPRQQRRNRHRNRRRDWRARLFQNGLLHPRLLRNDQPQCQSGVSILLRLVGRCSRQLQSASPGRRGQALCRGNGRREKGACGGRQGVRCR
jgi:alkyl sulfatase BDS1-like metallo-beta-lactamase superfamily hydrolase